MSEKRRRRSGGGGGGGGDGSGGSAMKRAGIIAVWVLGLFLAANLAVAMFRTDETGRPNSLVSAEAVAAAAFWVPVTAMAIAAGVGATAAWRGWRRSERPASLWLMRAFIVSLVLCVGITICALERSVDRRWFAICAVVAIALQTTLFAIAATRESRQHGTTHAQPGSGAAGYGMGEAARTAAYDARNASGAAGLPDTNDQGPGGPARPESTS